MADQTIFNIALAVAGCLGGWALRVLWDSVKDLQKADTDMAKRVSEIEVLVAGAYVKKDEYRQDVERIFTKLDDISTRLQSKADR